MSLSVITTSALSICAAKCLTSRSGDSALDKLFLRINKVAGSVLPLATGAFAARQARDKAGLGKLVSWLYVFPGVAGLMGSPFFTKKLGSRGTPLHRLCTELTGLALAVKFLNCVLKRVKV